MSVAPLAIVSVFAPLIAPPVQFSVLPPLNVAVPVSVPALHSRFVELIVPLSVPPLVTRLIPAPIKLLPLLNVFVLEKRINPVCASIVPLLISGIAKSVLPAPALFLNVPALVNSAPPPPVLNVWLFCASNTPPSALVIDAPFCTVMLPAPVHVAVPAFVKVKALSRSLVTAEFSAAVAEFAIVRLPSPDKVPPLQFSVPLTVVAPVPPNTPVERLSVAALSVLLALSVPPAILITPLLVDAPARVSDPPLIVKVSAFCNCPTVGCGPVAA